MDIFAMITGISYDVNCCARKLKTIDYEDFNINTMPSSCKVEGDKFTYDISKWVSPKRTRSYPYARVYDTLASSHKCVTVIPIIKDEGANGDRDYIQWDTISLMSLLDVYVVLAYYDKAEKHQTKENKITAQKYDNAYIKQKLEEIGNYKSSALHWNLSEAKSLPDLTGNVKNAYSRIGEGLNIKFHGEAGIDKFKKQFTDGLVNFQKKSREKSKEAQNREKQTVQPKEALSTSTKATITILNYLGGEYYLTTDEIEVKDDILYLVEGKHTRKDNLPKLGDIKDGLLKTILYVNLEDVEAEGKKYKTVPVLKLTSENITGSISSTSTSEEITIFLSKNPFTTRDLEIIKELFQEAQKNSFVAVIEWATT